MVWEVPNIIVGEGNAVLYHIQQRIGQSNCMERSQLRGVVGCLLRACIPCWRLPSPFSVAVPQVTWRIDKRFKEEDCLGMFTSQCTTVVGCNVRSAFAGSP